MEPQLDIKPPAKHIGLDIDEKSVKLVELQDSPGGPLLTKFGTLAVNPKDSPPASATTAAIKKLWLDLAIEEKEVYAAITGIAVSIRRLRIPEMSDNEVRGAIKWEAKNYLPFPVENLHIDYAVLGKVKEKNTTKLDILAVAVPEEERQKLIGTIEAAGLKVKGLTVAPFALWDLIKLTIKPPENEVVAVIDIGAVVASINLFKNNALQFTREMSVAGDSFTKCLTGTIVGDNFQLNLNLAQAEALKIRFGIPKEDATDQTDEGISLTQIRAALRPTLRRFSNEIQRSFDYYKEQFLEEKISKIYLSGGSSKLKNLDAFICESFAVPVEVLNPFQRIGLSTALKHKEAELAEIAPRLTLALGLAIGRAQSLNLIKEEKKKKPKTPATPSLNLTELKSKIKLGELAKIFENLPYTNFISGGLVILLLLCALGYNFYLSNRIAYYSKELASRKLALTDLKALISRRTIIKKISAEETKVRETLGKLASTLPSSITLSSLNYQNTTRTALITGTCSNIQKIGDIINAIESSPNFSEVQLKSAKKISDSEKMKIILRYRFTLIRNKQ